MTPRRSSYDRIRSMVPWAAILTAFTSGGAVQHDRGRLTALENEKQDKTTAVIRDSAIMVELRAIRADGLETKARVRSMYCVGKPAGCM